MPLMVCGLPWEMLIGETSVHNGELIASGILNRSLTVICALTGLPLTAFSVMVEFTGGCEANAGTA